MREDFFLGASAAGLALCKIYIRIIEILSRHPPFDCFRLLHLFFIAEGDVVQIEPKGWSEAMGLGEHELEGWEGPTQGEISRDVAVDVSIHTHEEAHKQTPEIVVDRNSSIPGGNYSINCPPKLVTPVRYFGLCF